MSKKSNTNTEMSEAYQKALKEELSRDWESYEGPPPPYGILVLALAFAYGLITGEMKIATWVGIPSAILVTIFAS